jgi:hypothetical protein
VGALSAVAGALIATRPMPPVSARRGIALGGTDPVASFAEGGPVAGSDAHAADWTGACRGFAGAAHRSPCRRSGALDTALRRLLRLDRFGRPDGADGT